MGDGILVTVGVLSYNSSKTILETLNSIKEQSYGPIELIIADDGSSDDTVVVCNEWINSNKSRFKRVQLNNSDQNRGTSANCNSLLASAKGVWLKIIAADDVLLTDSIQKCIDYVGDNSSIKWLVGKSLKYVDIIDEEHLKKNDIVYSKRRLSALHGTLEEQQKAIVDFNFIEAPNLFIKTEIIHEVGGYNEKYKLIEDWPLNLKLIYGGHKCFFLDEYIVGYRQSSSSVFNVKSKIFNIGYKESLFIFEKGELFKYHNLKYRVNKTLQYYLCVMYQKLGLNNSKFYNVKSYSLISLAINKLFKCE